MSEQLTGGCCCGAVSFTVKDDFKKFFFCHCEQCRKLSGSAHAANLFTLPTNITWTKGELLTKRFDHPTRAFSRVFCSECGSGLPFLTQNKKFLIVPAGSLDQEPSKEVDANIFCEEQTHWHKTGLQAEKVTGFFQTKK